MNNQLNNYIKKLTFDSISKERKDTINSLSKKITDVLKNRETLALNFICTHNSRRSHLTQIWAQTFARHYGFQNIHCYSAGTEATAVYPSVITTLKNVGFEVNQLHQGENPIYAIKDDGNSNPIIGFSKTVNHQFNPQSDFFAIMTCSHADQNCPFIPGAKTRFSLPYEDPKEFDNTELEASGYADRSNQIATEMNFMVSKIIK